MNYFIQSENLKAIITKCVLHVQFHTIPLFVLLIMYVYLRTCIARLYTSLQAFINNNNIDVCKCDCMCEKGSFTHTTFWLCWSYWLSMLVCIPANTLEQYQLLHIYAQEFKLIACSQKHDSSNLDNWMCVEFELVWTFVMQVCNFTTTGWTRKNF